MTKPTKEILKGEFIGKNILIVSASNPSLVKLHGKIVNESKHTITINTSKGKKTVLKQQVTMEMTHGKNKIRIDGSLLVGRPEDRIKMKVQ